MGSIAEVPGPIPERHTSYSTNGSTSMGVYIFFCTAVYFITLWRNEPVDALTHTFGTMAFAFFSQKCKVAHYGSAYIDGSLPFLCLAGSNFALHYHFLQGMGCMVKDGEFRVYFSIDMLHLHYYYPSSRRDL